MSKQDSPIAWAGKYIATDTRHASPETRAAAKALLACVDALEKAERGITSRIRFNLAETGMLAQEISDLVDTNPAIQSLRAALSLAKGEDQP